MKKWLLLFAGMLCAEAQQIAPNDVVQVSFHRDSTCSDASTQTLDFDLCCSCFRFSRLIVDSTSKDGYTLGDGRLGWKLSHFSHTCAAGQISNKFAALTCEQQEEGRAYYTIIREIRKRTESCEELASQNNLKCEQGDFPEVPYDASKEIAVGAPTPNVSADPVSSSGSKAGEDDKAKKWPRMMSVRTECPAQNFELRGGKKSTGGYCLDATKKRLAVAKCNGKSEQQFQLDDGHIKQGDLCVSATLTMSACDKPHTVTASGSTLFNIKASNGKCFNMASKTKVAAAKCNAKAKGQKFAITPVL